MRRLKPGHLVDSLPARLVFGLHQPSAHHDFGDCCSPTRCLLCETQCTRCKCSGERRGVHQTQDVQTCQFRSKCEQVQRRAQPGFESILNGSGFTSSFRGQSGAICACHSWNLLTINRNQVQRKPSYATRSRRMNVGRLGGLPLTQRPMGSERERRQG